MTRDAAKALRKLGACDEAIAWLVERSKRVPADQRRASLAWAECTRGDWMVWLVIVVGLESAPTDLGNTGRCECDTCGGSLRARARRVRARYSWPVVRDALLAKLRAREDAP